MHGIAPQIEATVLAARFAGTADVAAGRAVRSVADDASAATAQVALAAGGTRLAAVGFVVGDAAAAAAHLVGLASLATATAV